MAPPTMSATGAAQSSTTGQFVDCSPSAGGGLLSAQAALFVSLFYVPCHALLLVRVTRFVTLRHMRPFCFWLVSNVLLQRLSSGSTRHQSSQEQDEEDHKQDFRNPGRGPSNAGEAQHTCDQRHNQEYECPLKHIKPFSSSFVRSPKLEATLASNAHLQPSRRDVFSVTA